jgi:predicted nucleotidyltransferase
VAEDREQSGSDIDIIVVGDVPGIDLSGALRPLRDRFGREVNVTRYTKKEFASKAAEGHHFISAVLKRKRIFLIGGKNELDEVAQRETGGD